MRTNQKKQMGEVAILNNQRTCVFTAMWRYEVRPQPKEVKSWN